MSYRLYTFVNHIYMSEKQFGIQTAHLTSTMMNNVAKLKGEDLESYRMVHDWAENSPTIIMCQGGNVAMLTELYAKLKPMAADLGLPVAKFHEDEASLGGVITCVGVLVPEYLFDCEVTWLAGSPTFTIVTGEVRRFANDLEHEFLSIVKTARLA
jgi:hypothetical protein